MRKTIGILCLVGFSCLPALAQTTPPASDPQLSDELLQKLREEGQASKAVILGKNMTLSAEQAAKFWPLYEKYQKEQSAIIDAQLGVIRGYVEHYENLDDASAAALMKASFDRDAKMNELRQRWFGEFKKVLPAKLAVRAMHIDRMLSLAQQFEVASQLPLPR